MAQHILGVDLGAYSVKLVELETGFRQNRLHAMRELKLLDAIVGESALDRAVRTLKVLLGQLERHADVIALAIGAEATLRVLDMPFQDARKIDQVIGYELESQILGELDGLVVDQVLAENVGSGARVLAIGVDREQLRTVVAALAAVKAEPRYIGASLLSYGALLGKTLPVEPVLVPEPGDAGEELEGPKRAIDVVIDLGHLSTRVAFVEAGRTVFARGIQRGAIEVTQALAETYRLDEAGAERAKHAQAQLLTDATAIADPARRKLDTVLREALRPLLRDLRQTFAAARSQGMPAPRRLATIGGGARLSGLPELLEQELGVPVVALELPADLGFVRTGEEEPQVSGVALGMALGAGLGGGTQVNLRKGELSFRSDYSYLRGKAGYLGAAVMALLACVALNAFASLRTLRKEAEVLEANLKRETTDLFGSPKLDGAEVTRELTRGPQSGIPPVPLLTAYDVLDEISRHVPPKDQVKLDILELDIKPKKTYLKATTASAKEIDLLVDALKKIDCFGDIQKGKVATVTGPGADAKEKVELKQFTLTIETTCQ